MGSTKDSFSSPAAGKQFAAPTTLRASDAPSSLGKGADPSITQRVVNAPGSKTGITKYATGHTLAPSPRTCSSTNTTSGPSKNCSGTRT